MGSKFVKVIVGIAVAVAMVGIDGFKIPTVQAQALVSSGDWYMAGANLERTSWVSEEIRGNLAPLWYRPFEPYISQKVQVIAANDTLYISTAKGLYALDADTGAEKWVYPTEMPLGHSPTVADGVAYVGGFDKKIHAMDAYTGGRLWTFSAGQGFHTNPLVVNNILYAGNRDGHMYAIDTETGEQVWRFKTGGPVLYSAAYKDGVVFFASNDSHAYALAADTGSLLWKSSKLPGSGFHSWWPVIYRDLVIFSGSHNYKFTGKPGLSTAFTPLELDEVYPNHKLDPSDTLVGPVGAEPGDWAAGTPTIDTSKPTVTVNGSTTPITEYFEQKPWRRTYFVLSRLTGAEITYDFDADGVREYAPILWAGTHSGNRYPPLVGGDDVLYQQNNYRSNPFIARGHISGWKTGTPHISLISSRVIAVDEPAAYSGGGNLIYWSLCCDRLGGSFDLTQPGKSSGRYYGYNTGNGNSLTEMIPGYDQYFHKPNTGLMDTNPFASFGVNGPYGWHADGNPPIPYKGKVYMLRSNAIIAFTNHDNPPTQLPPVTIVNTQDTVPIPTRIELQSKLEGEVQKMINAGHLRPAYISHGIFAFSGQTKCGDDLTDYWHNSGETIYALVKAYPHLSPGLQSQVQTYLRDELTDYPPYQYNHIGWQGAQREIYDTPPDVVTATSSPRQKVFGFLWQRNPFTFYALWKYAEIFGDAQTLFDASSSSLAPLPSDADLLKMPFAHNAFIVGYLGYLNLQALAGYPESADIRSEYDRLLALRTSGFSKDSAYASLGQGNIREAYCRTLNVASNFMFLVPELAQYLRDNALPQVEGALDEYYYLAPYWFVSNAEEGFAENAITLFYDTHALFQAKALILNESQEELAKYIDVPAVEVGDLYYIQNLVAVLETPKPPAEPSNLCGAP